MKTTIKLILTLCWVMVSAKETEAQATYEGNDNFAPIGSFVGWNVARDLDFKTNDLLRIRINQNQSSTINGFTGIVQNGFFGISDNPGFFTGAGGNIQTKRFEIEVLPNSNNVNVNNNDGGIGTGEAEIQLRLKQIIV